MKQHRKGLRAFVGLAVIALVLTACRGGGESDASGTPGVTSDPCPNAVNPDNGCIYLGVISDLTKGPFAPLALPVTDAQKAFWKRVNEQGGVGGYDIDISKYVADAEYNPAIHNRKYQEMRNDILAMAQTLAQRKPSPSSKICELTRCSAFRLPGTRLGNSKSKSCLLVRTTALKA